MSPNAEFVATFLDELTDTLEAWNELLALVLSSGVDVPTAMKTMFRHAHNLKGASLSVELEAFGGFIHKVEDFVTQIRDGVRPFEKTEQELLKEVLETLGQWKMNLSNDVSTDYYPKDLYERIAKEIAKVESKKSSGESSTFGFFEDSDHEKEESSANPSPGATLLNLGKSASKSNSKDFSGNQVAGQEKAGQEKAGQEKAGQEKAGQEKIGKSESDASNHHQHSLETIRVPRERVEEILALTNEMSYVLASKGASLSQSSSEVKDLLVSVNPLNSELQESLFSLLLAPVDTLFSYLSKIALDTAKKTGKSVEIFMDGTSERLDKVVLEKIKDPLMHIVRNSVDHGLEKSDTRLKEGKSPTGRIEISAHKTSAGLWVEITDDGRGLDRDKIKAKAIEKDLISASAQLSEKECYDLLFLPGFSTAEKVTDVSGRGVGLDVVRSTINSLKGKVEIVSEKGKGTSFRLFFQAKLALIEAIQITHRGVKYVLATSEIKEIMLVKKSDFVSHPAMGRTINFNGLPVSVADFGTAIGAKSKDNSTESDFCSVFLVEAKGQVAGVAVDLVVEHKPVILEQLPSNLLDLPGVVGTTRLSDGMPAFVFDLAEMKNELSWTGLTLKGKAA
jgi:two-component system chemotaxis sensor kinase CheA